MSRPTNRTARNAIAALTVFCVAMALLQWLVGPARGARDLAYDLKYGNHATLGAMLMATANSKVLRSIDTFWQLDVNLPRNWILMKLRLFSFSDQADLFSWAHQIKPWHDFVYSAALILGSVVIYGPLLVVGARMMERKRNVPR